MVLPASHRISRVLRYSGASYPSDLFAYGAVTRSGPAFQPCSAKVSRECCWSTTPGSKPPGLASCAFARHYSRNLVLISSPSGTEMFHFPECRPVRTIEFIRRYHMRGGFPHSEIAGSVLVDSSPTLIAVCRVLHRLAMPRHPSCARIRLARNFSLSLRCNSL